MIAVVVVAVVVAAAAVGELCELKTEISIKIICEMI